MTSPAARKLTAKPGVRTGACGAGMHDYCPANTLAILELAEQQRIANLIALATLPSEAPDELLELRTEAAFHLVEYRQNGLDDEHLAVLPEIAVSLGMNTDEDDK